MIIMQKNWLKHNLKNPAILTAAIQFVIYRMAQKSKLQIFSKSSPNIETAFWNLNLSNLSIGLFGIDMNKSLELHFMAHPIRQ